MNANIHTILRKVDKEPKTPSLDPLAVNEFQTLRKEAINRSIKPEVIIHLDLRESIKKELLAETLLGVKEIDNIRFYINDHIDWIEAVRRKMIH